MVLTFKASFQPGIAWLIMHNQHHYAKFKDFYQILDIKLVQKSKKLKKSRSQRRKDVKEVKKSKKLRSSEVEQVEDVTVLHFSGAYSGNVGQLVGSSQKVLSNRSKDFLDIWHNDRGHQTMRQYRARFPGKNLDHSKIMKNMLFLRVINFL